MPYFDQWLNKDYSANRALFLYSPTHTTLKKKNPWKSTMKQIAGPVFLYLIQEAFNLLKSLTLLNLRLHLCNKY